jgi:hypothetical protein
VPTKRRKIPPRRIGGAMPEWARRLVETGEEPPRDGGAVESEYFGWLFLGEPIPGLPPHGSEEWKAICRGRRYADQA